MKSIVLKKSNSAKHSPTSSGDGDLLLRYATQGDQAAFRELVLRHGPMVLSVCQRVVHDRHAAEDAYQATFLVLARKAASVTRPNVLGNWLHGVAYRVASKLKVQMARRRAVESKAAVAVSSEPALQAAWQDVRAVLDEELNALPDAYRSSLVLVYLEGKTHEEAAQVLGCPIGSMSWRLQQGRELLRRRLQKRGLVVSAALLLLALAPNAAHASEALVEGAVTLAAADTLGAVAPGGIREQVANQVLGELFKIRRPGWLAHAAAILFLAAASAALAHEVNIALGGDGLLWRSQSLLAPSPTSCCH
jgi:RNA polymerase sigma factor (sigma-70 family)